MLAEAKMSDTPELTGVTPHLTIRDNKAKDAIAFYEKAFGAQELFRHPADDGVRLMHARLAIAGGGLMLHDDFPEMMGGKPSGPPACVVLHIEVPDADAAWEQAVAAGATVRFPLDNQFWGQRYGQLADPFGHVWSIGGPLKP
ncbi:putative glyoxalase/bleomycin resistance protein [Sphingosinicella microcystinivorans]|uniref:Glyoxalase/bleomycin resistance protein n=2 Tax=Sphingosinicella microcystinivorans TaxID=335406 RepID=A0AAD1D5M9_SPHMI|nr:putative glyoxalase/bleomycin resistance protein [Sphingosinicella microcystinivorans]